MHLARPYPGSIHPVQCLAVTAYLGFGQEIGNDQVAVSLKLRSLRAHHRRAYPADWR